jgi:hypothetical protein
VHIMQAHLELKALERLCDTQLESISKQHLRSAEEEYLASVAMRDSDHPSRDGGTVRRSGLKIVQDSV